MPIRADVPVAFGDIVHNALFVRYRTRWNLAVRIGRLAKGHRTRCILAGFLVALLAAECQASIVVIVATRSHVVVAADSRQTWKGVTDDLACKIRMGNRRVFVATGTYPGDLLHAVWVEGDRLANRPESARKQLDALERMLSGRKYDVGRAEFRGTLAFVEMTPDGPVAAAATFLIRRRQIAFQDYTRDWRAADFGAGYMIMTKDGSDTDLSVEAALIARHSLPDLVLLAESTVTKRSHVDASVGGPVNSVIIDNGGPRWCHQDKNCRRGDGRSRGEDSVETGAGNRRGVLPCGRKAARR